MDRHSPRKKVNQDEQKRNMQKAAVQEVLPGYEEYLVLLQERNRLLKRLRKKSKKQIDNERKEQGFSIYVSGANADKGRVGRQSPSKHPHHCTSPEPEEYQSPPHMRLKTAGDAPRKKLIDFNDTEMTIEEHRRQEEKKRLKTAPARERRRNWMAASLEVKTERGERCKIKAPEILTGNYDDDFEEDDSENENDEEYQVRQHVAADREGSHNVKSSKSFKQSSNLKQQQVSSQRKPPPPPSDDSETEEENDKLMLSIADIKKLRQSLAMNRSIRESLAKEVSSDEDISDRATPIQEEDIEEDLVPAIDSMSLDDHRQKKKPPAFKPTDTVVLELAAPPTKQKVEKNLSAARKKNVEEDVSISNSRKKYDQITENDKNSVKKSPVSLKSDAPSKKRPLSASRVNRKEMVDTEAETSAVLEALKAENEQASKLKQDSSKKLPQTSAKQMKRPSSAGKSELLSRRSQEARPLPRTPTRDSIPSSPRRHTVKTPSKESRQSITEQNDEKSFLLDDRLNDVMKKVLLMQPNQQKKLMKVLGKLESSTETEDDKMRPASSKPVKAVVPVKEMVNNVSRKSHQKSMSPENYIEVTIELLSSWGHSELLGLTELQFFDVNRQLIPVKKEAITVHGAREQRGTLDVLFNGKAKTNKERNMWCCRHRIGASVEICLVLPITSPDTEVARIKVWNYNKSLTELDIGVRHARIFLGVELVFDGEIEKGCGNQVFDYGFTINLKESANQTPRDQGNSSPPSLSPVIHTRSPVSDRSDSHKKVSRSIRSPSPSTDQRQTVSSLSQSSNESLHKVQQSSSAGDRITKGDKPVVKTRSETRTLNYSERDIPRPVIQSDKSGSETEDGHSRGRRQWSSPVEEYEDPRKFWVDLDEGTEDDSRTPGKPRGSRTPRKSKRMAAKLDGHSSTETDNSKSVGESSEQKPPKAPSKKAEEKPVEKSGHKSERKTEEEEEQDEDAILQSQDDVPMIQKLKEMNQNSKDQKRKKDVPKWLKQEDISVSTPFDCPPASRSGSRQEQRPSSEKPPLPLKDHMKQSSQANVDMLIDEELALWQERDQPLKTVFDEEKKKAKERQATSESSRPESKTPMQKIQNNRAKWRDTHKKNLEESWGSLNMFDRHQKGRISMDLDDDALDEYLQPSKKPTPQPVIKEEENEEGERVPVKEDVEECDNFTIPELPYGRELVINIKTTWGDKHYVGLTGVEVFSSTGDSVSISKISAMPKDINILPDYEKDPRVVTNLIDGVNRTRDDVHMWLTPFTANGNHYINITFDRACKIALMRIWNYNKSRIHSYRGAKDVVVTLDNNRIFCGEIARACGGIEGGTEAFGDTILFTTDEDILEAVSRNDDAYEGDMLSDGEPDDVPFERPSTADGGSDDERPFTRAVGNLKKTEKDASLPPRPATSMVTEGDVIVFKGKSLELNFTETWGDLHYLGLTGLEIVGKDGEALPFSLDMMTANPKDLHHLPGHERDDRTLDKLLDNTNITTSDEHMWLIPFNNGKNHTLVIAFNQTVLIAGLRVWNYNKSPEDTYRGAKTVHVTIDGKQVSPPDGYLIRKGPGNCHFDFAQEISFAPQVKTSHTPVSVRSDSVRGSFSSESLEEYESMQMPCGFIYQLQVTSTWGDPYYVGLNGVEFYDASHHKIDLTENNISAYPDSINVLSNTQNDVRTPDKLIDGVNSTMDGRHTWLAPILPTILNRVYVIFDQPTAVSMIKIWNYSKTPQRGAKDIALLVDDLLVYNGTLQAVRSGAKGILPTCDADQKYHTIIFTDNKEIIKKEKHSIISNQTGEQDIQLTNDKQVVSHYIDPKKAQQGKPVNQELRPKTSVPGVKKTRR